MTNARRMHEQGMRKAGLRRCRLTVRDRSLARGERSQTIHLAGVRGSPGAASMSLGSSHSTAVKGRSSTLTRAGRVLPPICAAPKLYIHLFSFFVNVLIVCLCESLGSLCCTCFVDWQHVCGQDFVDRRCAWIKSLLEDGRRRGGRGLLGVCLLPEANMQSQSFPV